MLALFTLPAMAWYTLFTIGPLVAVFTISFLDWRGILAPASWTALANYERMLSDPIFWSSCVTTALHLLGTLPPLLVLSFMLGFYVSLNPPGVRFLRPVLFIPGLLSLAAQGMVFFAVLSPNGMLNSLLSSLGLANLSTAWLANPATALPSLIAISLWGGIGYTAILFAAHLSGIDSSVYEAAELDGANRWTVMWRVAFPMTRSYFGVMAMLQFLWTLFGSAAIILLLTQGGPGLATTTLSWLIYQKAFLQSNIGYSQAIGVVLFVVGLAGILAIRRIFRQSY